MTTTEARTLRANMKGKAVRMLLAAVLALGLAPALPPSAFAADGSVSYVGGMESWNDPNGYLQQSCYMEVNGDPAMCCEHFKDTPSQGSSVTSWGVVNDGSMRKILFYGAGGPEDTGAYSLTQTACALSNAYGTTEAVASAWPIVHDLASRPEPPTSFVVTLWAGGGSTQRLCSWTYNPSGFIDLDKDSSNPAITDGNGCYSLAGAVYGVFASWGDASNRANPVAAIVTNADGYGRSGELAVGTYYVRETQMAPGFGLDERIYEVGVNAGATSRVNAAESGRVYDAPQNDPAVMWVGKIDLETTLDMPQGSASLEGAEFTVLYYDSYDVTADNYEEYAPKCTWVVATDADGYAELLDQYKVGGDDYFYNTAGVPTIPLGTVVIKETAAPAGYRPPDDATVHLQQVTSEGHLEAVETYNAPIQQEQVIRGGVSVEKRDLESMLRTPLGGAVLDGVTLEIKSLNDNEVVVDGVAYGTGEVVATLVTKDCTASTSADALPYGRYSLSEASANAGYNTSGQVIEFEIVNDGEIVKLHGEDAVKNQVKRGDIEFTKKHGVTSSPMANVPFAITSKTTGEHHVAVTDENGYFSSSASFNPHTRSTNANDDAAEGAYDARAGIWFGLTSEGTTVEPDDDLAALPFDVYDIEELPCAANEGMQLVKMEGISITRDNYTVDLGSVDDPQATIATSATDSFDGDKIVVADAEASVTDRVSYANLIPGRTYTLSGTLVDKAAGGALVSGGDPVTSSITFTPDSPSGYVNMTFRFDASALSGKSLVATEELALDGRPLASHVDLDDAEQTVTVAAPKIGTAARDAADGDKDVTADPEARVVDTVAFRNLLPGEEYILKGRLMDKQSGEVLVIDGREATSELSFTPEDAGGTVEMAFDIDTSALSGKEIVAFEELYREGKLVAEHADLGDAAQTVNVVAPEIATAAMSANGFDQTIEVDPEARIVDRVSYKNLVRGGQYTLKGALMDKAGGAPVKDASGNPVTAEIAFAPADDNGAIDMSFEVDTSSLAGREIVVFEELYREGKLVAEHKDIGDAKQTVLVVAPTLATEATDTTDADKSVTADPHALITDTVEYSGVIAGSTYKLTAALVDVDTGEVIVSDGRTAVESIEFTAKDTYGVAQVAFEVDTSSLAGRKLVVYETLSRNGVKLAEHADIGDARQTVDITAPVLETEAADAIDGDKLVAADPAARIIDAVSYRHLNPGYPYTLEGAVVDKASGEPVKDAAGNPAEATTEFTPDASHGTVEMVFDVDASELAGKELVAVQKLYREGRLVAEHADLDDAAQTVSVKAPELDTLAKDAVDGDKTIVADPAARIIDSVSYKGLNTHYPYVISGTLVDKASGEPLPDEDGNPVASAVAFTPEASYGNVEMAFDVDASVLANKEIVVFQELVREGKVVAVHADLDDTDQTVAVEAPALATVALDAVDGDKNVVADPEAGVIDTVRYSKALAGADYTLRGTIVDAETGEPLANAAGEPVRAETAFTTLDTYGAAQVAFDIDASALAGRSYVVFQELLREGKVVATHADVADPDQTFGVTAPRIATSAADGIDGDKNVVADPEMVLVDKVAYENLVPGKPYTLAGTLMDKASGLPLADENGNPIASEVEFTPEAAKGSVEVPFALDGSLLAGKDLVVFEALSRSGATVAVHADINDAAQTVSITPPEVSTSLVDAADSDKLVVADGQSTVVDTVAYENLVPGKPYAVRGTLMDAETSAPLLVPDYASVPEGASVVRVLNDVYTVTYESTGETADIAVGSYVKATDGTYLPLAGIADDGTYNLVNAPSASMGLEGYEAVHVETYERAGTSAYYLASGALVPVPTSTVTAETVFVPEKPSGSVEVAFDLDSSTLAGRTLVAFEELYRGGILMASHADIDDAAQTVEVIATNIATSAADGLDGDKVVVADGRARIVDTVSYRDVVVGGVYTLRGILMDKATGLPLVTGGAQEAEVRELFEEICVAAGFGCFVETQGGRVYRAFEEGATGTVADYEAIGEILAGNAELAGQLVCAQAGFVPDAADGTAEVAFDFDASRWVGQEKAIDTVVFEVLEKDGRIVAAHADIDDEGQRVAIAPSEIDTVATDKTDGDHELIISKSSSIVDTVSYGNLVPSKAHELSATLVDKESGEPLLVGDAEVAVKKDFIPNQPDGTVEMTIELDSTALAGKEVVVFEELSKDGIVVASHTDLEDADQTVRFVAPPEGGAFDKTGNLLAQYWWMLPVLGAVACALGAAAWRLRRHDEEGAPEAETD